MVLQELKNKYFLQHLPTLTNCFPSFALVDVVLTGLVIALVLGMGGSAVVPALDVRSVAPGLDLVLDTVTTFVALSVVEVGLAALAPWPFKLIVDHVLIGLPFPEALARL